VCTGGDISQAYHLESRKQEYFIKLNSAAFAGQMFTSEFRCLEILKNKSSFRIPTPIHNGTLDSNTSFIAMEYIATGTEQDFELFGNCLAQMHKQSSPMFGFEFDNYIGTLEQVNSKTTSAHCHYRAHRIEPLVERAFQKGLLDSSDRSCFDTFYKVLEELLPMEVPALIHGDLWGGNYMFSNTGEPVIYDPAPCYSMREFDIAMMHLFGGFPSSIIQVYNNTYPLIEGWKNRMQYYQLYYLLVHLCLFGSAYYGQVMKIMHKFK